MIKLKNFVKRRLETVQFHYNIVHFLKNTQYIHPTFHQLGFKMR